MLFAGVLALAGCGGSDGSAGATGPTGPQGPAGQDGAAGKDASALAKAESCATCHPSAGSRHQAIYDKTTDATVLTGTIDSVVSTPNATPAGTFTSIVTFTVKKNGVPYTEATVAGQLGQQRYTGTRYDPITKKFETATAITYAPASLTATATPGQYTVKATAAKFAPEASNAFVYLYMAETEVPAGSHYQLYDNVLSLAKAYGTVDFATAAPSANCEKCHPAPYLKHGYRAGAVAGIPDMVACKACHHDQRNGGHQDWQVLVDDPARFANIATTPLTADEKAKYAYVASTMNDTHMSHAMEFAYPQSMANCVTCHEGKLEQVLTDANFTLATCKSCHPVTGPATPNAKRAPALKTLMAPYAVLHTMDLYASTGSCNSAACHTDGGAGKRFAQLHTGYDKQIRSDATTKIASAVAAKIDSASFDAATNKVTVSFSATGIAANALVKPTVVVSLYGYDTKDFVVSGHGSQADGTYNLEWTEGAKQRRDPTKAATSDRLTVSPGATAGNAAWTAVADLTTWADKLADGTVRRIEIAILPTLGLDQAAAVSSSNPAVAMKGDARTFDLVANALVAEADAYGKKIVSADRCNKCHDALGTTFHNPNYGSAGIAGCRVCHTVNDGGGHLEMQSRSIDSYVHAIHAMQPFDVGSIDFADKVAATAYAHHVESTYPNFTLTNCQSCHEAGTFDVPDQSKSLPGVLSASATLKNRTRDIGAVKSMVTGPASRACGSCHRAHMINEDAAGELASFDAHTASFGTHVENGTGVLASVIAKVMAAFK